MEALTIPQQLAKMFSVKHPEGLDSKLLDLTAGLWKAYWLTSACMAGVTAVIFFLAFRDHSADQPGNE